MNEKQGAKLSGVPGIYQNVFARAYAGSSRSAGIKAFCLDCVGFQRSAIRDCTSLACPLYPYRPYQTDEEDDTAAVSGSSPDNATGQMNKTVV